MGKNSQSVRKLWFVIGGIFLLAGLMLAITACGSSSTSSSGGGSETVPAGGNAAVTLKDLQFSPSDLTVVKGATVTWSNQDSVDHTITSKDKLFDSGHLKSGQNFGYTFNETGTFEYSCTIHPQMTGKVTVTD